MVWLCRQPHFSFSVPSYTNVTKKAVIQGRLFESRQTCKETPVSSPFPELPLDRAIETQLSGARYRLYLDKYKSEAEDHIEI